MSIYDFNVKDRHGVLVNLGKYQGKVLLIMNTATQCGFTPQYDALQALFEKYEKEGLVVLDFPCNQFGNQAPGSVEEIASFCDSKYGVTFPIFSKLEVNGENADPLFKYLVGEKGFAGFDKQHPIAGKLHEILSASDPDYDKKSSIKWNFTKFLIDRNGNVVERFEPTDSINVVEEKVQNLL